MVMSREKATSRRVRRWSWGEVRVRGWCSSTFTSVSFLGSAAAVRTVDGKWRLFAFRVSSLGNICEDEKVFARYLYASC